jgi:hypothetical protein
MAKEAMSPQEAFTYLESNDERILAVVQRLTAHITDQRNEIVKIKTQHKVDMAILEAKVANLEVKMNKGEQR